MDERPAVRPGHLLFGLAFAAIGIGWLLADGDSVVDAVWLVALGAFAIGVAIIATVVAWLVR